jgi:hypothetical protein
MSCPIGFDCKSMTGFANACPNLAECSSHESSSFFSSAIYSRLYTDGGELISRSHSDRSGELVQIDHTLLDCYVLDSENRPRRPQLSALLDPHNS